MVIVKFHEELKKWKWRISEYVPRWELENDPPPPRRLFRWGPTGQRLISKFVRNTQILIDSNAKKLYRANPVFWSNVDPNKIEMKFVDTGAADMCNSKALPALEELLNQRDN